MKNEPVVVDTNVVVSGILTRLPSSPTARILDGMLAGRFRFLLSLELLAEYREVLLRSAIRRRHGLSDAEIDVVLTEIAANGMMREVELPTGHGRRRDDDHIWRILEAVTSAFLVTGDGKLAAEPKAGGRVFTPRAFADLIDSEG